MTPEKVTTSLINVQKLYTVAGQPYKFAVYDEFILWYAMPYDQKKQLGIESQGQFADYYKVEPHTLSRWKDRPDFESRVTDLRKKWAFEKTSDVLKGIYAAAIKGNPYSQSLWMNFVGLVKDKNDEDVKKESKAEVTLNDIRFIIRGLPPELQQKHYANLRDLLIEADLHGSGERLEAGDRRGLTETELREQADIVSQAIPRKRGRKIPNGHSECVCEAVERNCDESNHQSTSWWWQE